MSRTLFTSETESASRVAVLDCEDCKSLPRAVFDKMTPGVEYELGGVYDPTEFVVRRHGEQIIARKLETFHKLSILMVQ